jgi:hypothetical protein
VKPGDLVVLAGSLKDMSTPMSQLPGNISGKENPQTGVFKHGEVALVLATTTLIADRDHFISDIGGDREEVMCLVGDKLGWIISAVLRLA